MKAEQIKEMAMNFQVSRVLLTAYELGIFTALSRGSKTAAITADILKTNPRSTERLMNVLCALGFLRKNKNKFSNSPSALHFLVKGRPGYMKGLMHTAHLWDSWSTLTQAVRAGKSVIGAKSVADKEKIRLEAFIGAMHERAGLHSERVVSILNLSGVSKVLDVGGGSGAYAMAFVRAKKEINAVVFDLPNVVRLTRGYINKEKLSNRVAVIKGDYNKDNLGRGFDLVFLSAIIHSNSGKQNLLLIKKCARALNSGGRVVVQDFIMDEDRVHPVFGAFFALNMLVGTQAGDTFTESEVKGWMIEAGLSEFERKDTDFGTTLLIARKKKQRGQN